jgi:malonyl CoA-acyl carrier protein transacylase
MQSLRDYVARIRRGLRRPAPAATTAKQDVSATTLPELPSFVTAASSTAALRSHIIGHSLGLVTALAKTKTKVCTKAEKVKVRVLEHLSKHHN